jgi:uncharacterized protein
MKSSLFLDTSFTIAQVSTNDQYNQKARFWSEKIQADRIPLITTQAVLLEIGNALSNRRFRQITVTLLEYFAVSESIQIVPLTDDLYNKAFNLFRSRPDKDWGLIDCISFVVMTEKNIPAALTADEHFIQAGFTALLR